MRPDPGAGRPVVVALIAALALPACDQVARPETAEDPCVVCHDQETKGIKLPVHGTAEVSDDCESCHTQQAWAPATHYDHDAYWPLVVAGHKPGKTTCPDCHPDADNVKDYTCVSCKDHDEQSMDPAHAGMSGYAYVSQLCVSCHPKGVK